MSLKSVLTTNIQMKLLSLLLAVLLWLFVALEAVDEIDIPFSVSYFNTPSGLVVKASSDGQRLIRIKGKRILLLRQALKEVSICLDLVGAKEGEAVFSVGESTVNLVQGVEIVRLLPVELELRRKEILLQEPR